MDSRRYNPRFLSLFQEDLAEIIDYITVQLKNPAAAEALVDDILRAIDERSHCAEAFEPYPSLRDRPLKYYRIYVRNYTVYYVVIGDTMEVRRILYNRRNSQTQL